MSEERDYLALILCSGMGTYWRCKDRDEAIKRCAKLFKSDFKSILKIGKTVKVNVYDVTGYDEVWWDDRGLWSRKKQIDVPWEIVDYTY